MSMARSNNAICLFSNTNNDLSRRRRGVEVEPLVVVEEWDSDRATIGGGGRRQ